MLITAGLPLVGQSRAGQAIASTQPMPRGMSATSRNAEGSAAGPTAGIAGRREPTNHRGVFAAMIVLAVVALLADFLLTRVEKRLLKWRPAAF